MPRSKPHTEETKRKIGLANRKRVLRNCNYCQSPKEVQPSKAKRHKRHFCNTNCYSNFRKEMLPKEEQYAWKGGISPYEAHKRWVKKNPERIAHLKARRYAREKGAEGSHSLEEWRELKNNFDNKCANCGEDKKLTKDHIIPLSEGGSDYIENIQPLCRNCNSRKWKKVIHENPELIN